MTDQQAPRPEPCRICGADAMRCIKAGTIPADLQSSDFAITDSRYGATLPLYECGRCGFRQCVGVSDLLAYYENLVDPLYEQDRELRKVQLRAVLSRVLPALPRPPAACSLLDVGAGSGILVEAALEMGFAARGVEPSRWLAAQAAGHGLPVACAALDDEPGDTPYDVITVVDIIEHVEDPLGLLRQCAARLKPGGLLVVVTPDCRSLAARLFGWKWWHYRIAHVGYFDPRTLSAALAAGGFRPIAQSRPGWVFTLHYLCQRLTNYLPGPLVPRGDWTRRVTVPLNLGDSMLVVAARV